MICELLAQGPLNQAQTVALIPVGQPDRNGLQVSPKHCNQLYQNDRC